MIATFSEYIDRFIKKEALGDRPLPGEHHFVAVYLLPVVYEIITKVPDYVNPDGTKKVIGDLVFLPHDDMNVSIEVKLDTIRLTKNEFNSSIVDLVNVPDLFVGIGVEGVIALEWERFRQSYIELVQQIRTGWAPQEIEEGYGPQRKVGKLFDQLAAEDRFAYSSDPQESSVRELQFRKRMSVLLGF